MVHMSPWPMEYTDHLLLGNLESNFGICCFWSSKDRVRSLLDSRDYAVIGNLYSRAGINPMLRNILANPAIRYLVLTGKSLTDSEDAIVEFFRNGVDIDWKIIRNGGQIDQDLPMEVLEEVRRSVELIDLRGAKNFAVEFREIAKSIKPLRPFAEPRIFPKTVPSPGTFPSEFLGFVVRQRTIFEAWCEIVWTVMTFGEISPTDFGLEQKEVLALLSVIENPAPLLDPLPDWAPFEAKDVEDYIKRFFGAERIDTVAYNYGHRLQSHWGEDQIALLATELKRSARSRRALASLWDPREDSKSTDPPCLTTIQLMVRGGRLHLMAYIRSNDMFRAYPLNAVALAALQARVASDLADVGIGSLAIVSLSAHVYSDCWDACQPAVGEMAKLRKQFMPDQRGSFVLHVDDHQLAADHYNPEGDLVQQLRGKNSRDMGMVMAPFVGRVDHGIYLGREISRLVAAFESGTKYEQDKVG